jgi:hypothetical protein
MSSPTVSGGPKGDRAVETAAEKLEAFIRGVRKPRPRAPSGPQLARPKQAMAKWAGGMSPWAVTGVALGAGYILAKTIDWRGHAHPRD